MTYTHKLARRLARLRALPPHCAMVPALALAAACSAGVPTGVDTSLNPADAQIVLSPRSVMLEANQVSVFKAYATGVPGDSLVTSIEWTATGGTIALNGTYSSPSTGDFKVVGKRHGPNRTTADTSTVTVVPPQPTITSVVVSPGSASVTTSTQQTFSAVGKLSDGSTVAIGVSWTATGGSIDPGGVYTAGSTAGTYRVIAQAASANVADTVPVTVTAPAPPPPSGGTGAYPNLPTGYSIPTGYVDEFTNSGLAEGAFGLVGGGFTIRDASTYNPGGGITPPSHAPASPNPIGEVALPTGFPGGNTPGSVWTKDFTTNNWTHLYMAITVQLSSNWYGNGSGVNKVLIANIHQNPCFVLSASGSGTGALVWQFRLQNLGIGAGGTAGSAVNLNANLGSGAVTRGLWQRVEVEAIGNTPGVSDGVLRMWLTNYNSSGQVVSGPTKIAEYTNVGWSASGQSNLWNAVSWNPIWGGIGGTIPATQYQWMDRLAVGGR